MRLAVEAILEESANITNGNGEYITYEEFIKEVIVLRASMKKRSQSNL